ncbi:MAG: nicotinate (nicotinamide) nucleotide adenylyltransferase [Bacteroidales bacterium]|nr:nicotinate (nicotinamide) nucleotide adenylyltransferase [Bacteroidales bacterium]
MKIGIYSGSFNPVHFGHTGLALWILNHTDLDEIWMMVTPNNPLKDATIMTDEATRLFDLRKVLATIGDKRCKASDFEFSLPRPSYTAETLRQLRKQYPEHEFVLIIGEDNWEIFDKWKDYDEILAKHTIYIYPRHLPASKTSGLSGRSPVCQRSGLSGRSPVYLKDAPLFDISSTEIRNLGL